MFGTKAAQRGVYSVPRGKCRPSGHNGRHRQVFAFGMKTVHGRRRWQMAAVSTSFRVWDESRSEERSEDECGPFVPVGGRQALRSTRIQTETIRRSSRDPKRAVVVLPLPLGGNRLYHL